MDFFDEGCQRYPSCLAMEGMVGSGPAHPRGPNGRYGLETQRIHLCVSKGRRTYGAKRQAKVGPDYAERLHQQLRPTLQKLVILKHMINQNN